MLTLRKVDYEDKDYDGCGNTAIAVLEIDSISIPLCTECFERLNEDINTYNNTIFCHKCSEFIMSPHGWHYGGSCKQKALQDGKVITERDAGYNYCVDCLDTCNNSISKEF